jgi:glycosyltransferase involved in cell wall biosynthesis
VTLDRAGDDFVVAARTIGRHPYLFLYGPGALLRAFRAAQYDVLDIHEEPASLATAELMLFARLFQPNARILIYTAQNLPKRYPLPFRWIERLALRRADAIYACTSVASEVIKAKGFTGRVKVIGLGVDVDRFKPVAPPAWRNRVGYVGRLEAHKGVHVLLDAVRQLPDVSLEIVGDGPERAALEALAAEPELAGRVTFQGFAGHASLPRVYEQLDVVVIPSIPTSAWDEQFCRVAIEAMAAGRPVIASATGSLPEVVGDAGMMVRPRDPIALAEAIRTLGADARLRSDLSKQGRKRSATFAWSAIARAHVALYREVVGCSSMS